MMRLYTEVHIAPVLGKKVDVIQNFEKGNGA